MFDNKKGKHSHIFMSFACLCVLVWLGPWGNLEWKCSQNLLLQLL